MKIRRVRKAAGALLGAVTAGVIVWVAGRSGVDMAPEAATGIALLLGTLGTYIAPANDAEPGDQP